MQKTPILTKSVRAAGAIVRRRFVTYGRVQAPADALAYGVSNTDAANGAMVAIDVLGTTIVESGAAVAEGDPVKSDAQGRAIPQAGSGALNGRALQPATAAGQSIEILLIKG